MEVLSRRAINRAVLARQCLLERSRAPLARLVERVGGIQAQYAPSTYVGLWSRVGRFERAQLDRALERRSVIQGTLMRSTIHVVSRADYWPLALAVRGARRRQFLRAYKAVSDADMVAAAGAVRARLREQPTVTRKELDALVGKERALYSGLWVDLVRVPPAGTWERRRADAFGLAEDWVGPPDATVEEGVAHLVRRYLAGFGPASRADIQNFTGLLQAELAPALEGMKLRRFADESGGELLDVPRAPLPDPDTPAPPRYIPTFDAILWAHCRRAGILRDEDRERLITPRKPHYDPVFLVDGTVAGTWRHEGGRIVRAPFARLDRATTRALDGEAERLLALQA